MSSGAHAIRIARALPGLVREVEIGSAARPLLLGGEPSAAGELSRALARGGDPALARVVSATDLEQEGAGGAALVYVLRGELTPAAEHALQEADRLRLPLVCLALDGMAGQALPYVRATDVVRGSAIDGAVVAAVAKRIAATADEEAWALARGLPALRRPVAEVVVRRFARQNALIGAAVFVPGADLPILTLNQLRMVLRVAAAYGWEADERSRIALGGIVATGFGLRGLARGAGRALPLPAFALKSGVAYAATRAIGAAAIALAERRAT